MWGPRDHPRSRGVYSVTPCSRPPVRGSSPLARGLLPLAAGPGLKARIIPARAGFTSGDCLRRGPWSDHPRSRGVYDVRPGDLMTFDGSSPLARGLPFLRLTRDP